MTEFNLFSKAPNGELHTKWEEYKKSLQKKAFVLNNMLLSIALQYVIL